MVNIASNLEAIQERIARAAERSGRSADTVPLIGMTKTVATQHIREAVRLGVMHLGENKVQEAETKFGEAEQSEHGGVPRTGVTLHLIGSLQRNKAQRAVALFDCIHSVDRLELAESLDVWAHHRSRGPLPVLLQVNLTGEATKSGVSKEELPRLAAGLTRCPNLSGAGLMTISRLGAEEAELRRTFSMLCGLLEDLRHAYPGDWTHLSMGMSDDYEYAIQEGATMVRLGRAIFGERKA